ncbi:MAG: TIGR04211 family SH3 domain-containing protein [Gammaproteobacteria bacterium]|nr:TIGR04211 family SH3 domain-containing protein [Gammaproteobacteria bacterium]MBT8445131.1 TIGR04211 family SH3 domain-containing protein [Gammaproteobacteria bacterium]
MFFLVLGLSSTSVVAQQGEAAWVTDQFEITMRNGKGSRQTIVRMLPSGTRLEVIEVDKEEGYSRVRTRSGAEGWVLNRYLLRQPPARVTMPDVQAQLASSEAQRKQLAQELRDLQKDNATVKGQLGQAESSGDDLQRELARITALSSNTVKIDAENRQLKQTLAQTQQALEDAEAESRRLASRSNREWFVIGALVVIFGILVGLILPRIRWRKKSSWGEL